MKYLFNGGIQNVNEETAFTFKFYYSEDKAFVNHFRRAVM